MRTPPSHSDRSNAAPGTPAGLGSSGNFWPGYYAAAAGKPPRDTLLRALALFDQEPAPTSPRFALDVGCGSGRDSLELLRRGWRVLALDAEPDGVERLLASAPPEHASRLTARVENFEQFMATAGAPVDLLNASCTLPFCPPPRFPALWAAVVAAVRPGGRFSGHFFGERDEWGPYPPGTHHTRPEIEKLLAPFAVELLDETEQDAPDAFGNPAHHHVFHVVGRRL